MMWEGFNIHGPHSNNVFVLEDALTSHVLITFCSSAESFSGNTSLVLVDMNWSTSEES